MSRDNCYVIYVLQEGSWYLNGSLPVHIIDGQQRIATVVLTYAILHYMIHQILGKNISDDETKRLQDICDRFTWTEDESHLLLKTSGE